METPEAVPPSTRLPPLSEAVRREIEALRAMLGLPPEEREPDERAPPEATQPDKKITPITTPRTDPDGRNQP